MSDDTSPSVIKGTGSGLWVPALDNDYDVLTAALAYAKAGWYVVPLKRGSKHPGSVLGDHWQHQSSKDPDQLASWFAASSYGVALHVGRSGAVVFDVDVPDLLPRVLADAIEGIQPPFQSTRTNVEWKGHFVFLAPPECSFGNSAGKLGSQWGEVRGRNGIIVVAPSVHEKATDGGRYEWLRTGKVPLLPDSLADELPDSAEGADAATDAEVKDFLAAHTDARMPGALFAVLRSFQREVELGGSRHAAMVTATCWAAREAAAGAYPAKTALLKLRAAFTEAMAKPREGSDRVASTKSATAEFMGIVAWAIAQAKTADLALVRQRLVASNKDRSKEPDLSFDSPTSGVGDELVDLDATEELDHDPVAALLAEMLSAEEIRKLPPPKPLIKGLLNLDSESWIIGKPGTFKSFIALDMAAHIATGRQWQQRYTERGEVIYIVAEGVSGMGLRINAWETTHGELSGIRFLPRPVQAHQDREWRILVEACARIKPSLIVIDTQARVTVGLEENSASSLGVFIEKVRQLREATDACVLVVHHQGKHGEDSRGSNAIAGAQTSELTVTRDDSATNRVTVKTTKQKDMAQDVEIELELITVEVGVREQTKDKLTSLAVVETDPWAAPPEPKKPWRDYLSPNQDKIIDVMTEHVDDEGMTPIGIYGLVLARWRETPMPKTSFYTAFNALKAQGKIISPTRGRWCLDHDEPEYGGTA